MLVPKISPQYVIIWLNDRVKGIYTITVYTN
jgi:hypothetical protein